MKIKVLYFAFLRDAMGCGSEEIEAPETVKTADGLRDFLIAQGEPWAGAFASVKRVRFSVNRVMARDGAAVKDGDEVAFFPPVTGG